MKKQYCSPEVVRIKNSDYAEIFCPNCFHSLDNPEQCSNCGTNFNLERISDGVYKKNDVILTKCNRCNSEAQLLFDWDGCDYYIECTNCHFDIPVCDSIEEAINYWEECNGKK